MEPSKIRHQSERPVLESIMLDLPSELYDEIVSQFTHSIPYIPSNRNSFSRTGQYKYDAFKYYVEFPTSTGIPDVQNLRTLRLVSKSFHRAATLALFKHKSVIWYPASEQLFHEKISSTNSSISSVPAPAMKRLKVNFQKRAGGLYISHPFSKADPDAQDPKNLNTSTLQSFIEQRFSKIGENPELERFELVGPGWLGHSGRWPPQAQDLGTTLDLQLLELLTSTLCTSLSILPFSNLTSLRLQLPCTHDYVLLSNALPNSLLDNLKELCLGVADATGPGGNRRYQSYTRDASDGDEDQIPSNLQTVYPNADHASGLFDIVSHCHNLESLGISATHLLDGDLIRWKPSAGGLKTLYLDRINFSARNLIALLSPASGCKSNLTHLWMEELELMSDVWSTVFEHILELPKLKYINPINLVYSRHGKSSMHKATNYRPWEDTSSIWSFRIEDEKTLLAVVRMAMGRWEGGEEEYPNLFYEKLILPWPGQEDEGNEGDEEEEG